MIVASLYSRESFPTVRETLKACLSFAVVDAVHLFCNYGSQTEPGLATGGLESVIDELDEADQRIPGGRFHIRGSAELALLGPEYDCTFLVGGRMFVPLAQRRMVTGDSTAPICSILTGPDLPTQLSSYIGILASAGIQDALVTTCGAELAAVRKGMEQGRTLLADLIPELELASDKMSVVQIPPAINPARLSILDRIACRSMLGLEKDATIVLNVGKWPKECSPDLEPLLYAFRLLLDENPNLLLVLANNDRDIKHSQEFNEYCQWLGLGPRIKALPSFQDPLKAIAFSAADVVVSLTDNVVSPFDHSVLEAMVCGIPVVASDWCGNKEMVLHGETGFLVPTLWNEPAAAIVPWLIPGLDEVEAGSYLARRTIVDIQCLITYLRTLTDNGALREKLGGAGRRRVLECFTWDQIIKRFQSLWEEQTKRQHRAERGTVLGSPFRFDAICRQYASRSLSFDMEIVTSERAAAFVSLPGGDSFPIHMGGVVGEFRNEILRILDYCTFPRTIQSVRDSGNEFAYEAVVWLLKKGFCELRYSSSQNAAS